MNAQEKALVSKFAAFLVGSGVRKVNFYFRGVPFGQAQYKYISECLAWSLSHSGLFGGLRGIGVSIEKMPANTGAQYEIDDNEIVVPHGGFGDSHIERMHIVHECTHACIDGLYAKQKIPRLYNEASAYLAGGLYNVYAAASADGPFAFTPTTGIFFEAHKVAVAFRKRTEANPSFGVMQIMETEAADLLKIIKEDKKTYDGYFDDPKKTYGDDGIKF
jgi:hypothetical protein